MRRSGTFHENQLVSDSHQRSLNCLVVEVVVGRGERRVAAGGGDRVEVFDVGHAGPQRELGPVAVGERAHRGPCELGLARDAAPEVAEVLPRRSAPARAAAAAADARRR